MIVEAGNIIIADKALRAIVSPYAERLWHIDLGIADVVSRTGRAEIALMQSIEFLLRRIAAPLHPALQDADRLVVKGQRLLDDLIEHAECYMPPAKIDGTPPTPIDDDPEYEESMKDLMYHADQYFQPGDDIEYYDPHHDWYVKNWEGEDIPSTFSLNDEDDKTDK